jgi:hypothetical protein
MADQLDALLWTRLNEKNLSIRGSKLMRACLCWPSVYSARFAFYLSYRAHRDTFSHSRACDDLPILSSPPPYPFFSAAFMQHPSPMFSFVCYLFFLSRALYHYAFVSRVVVSLYVLIRVVSSLQSKGHNTLFTFCKLHIR